MPTLDRSARGAFADQVAGGGFLAPALIPLVTPCELRGMVADGLPVAAPIDLDQGGRSAVAEDEPNLGAFSMDLVKLLYVDGMALVSVGIPTLLVAMAFFSQGRGR